MKETSSTPAREGFSSEYLCTLARNSAKAATAFCPQHYEDSLLFMLAKRIEELEATIASSEKPRTLPFAELLEEYKNATPEKRQQLIHAYDCPKAWDFFKKHASGSKLCPSCLMCGQQEFDREQWGITHLELPDIYICKPCVEKARNASSAREQRREVAAPSKDSQEASRVVKRGLPVHFEAQNIMADEILRLGAALSEDHVTDREASNG